MRDIEPTLSNAASEVKEASARLTFRKTLPVFTKVELTDSLGLTDPAQIDSCNWGGGILRVVNVGDVLYTQEITDINAAWPAWVNTGISLLAGSRPAVDAGYVWYQKPDTALVYRYFGTWGSEVGIRLMPDAMTLVPIANRGWAIWQRNAGAYEIVSLHSQDTAAYTIFGPTTRPWCDAVSINGKEYFYTMDRDEGRIIEIQHSGASVTGMDSYGVGKPIIPIDAISDDYGLKLGYASVINGKVFVTGKLTRTSDADPVTMDVYCVGPENFSLGREMFIQTGDDLNGKVLLVDDQLIVAGAEKYYIADATILFGYDNASLKLQTSDMASITLSEAENRTSTVDADLSTDLASDPLVVSGNEVTLEMIYSNENNDEWGQMGVFDGEVKNHSTTEQGETLQLSGVGKSAKRLSQWSPDQGIYVPSQARVHDFAYKMTKVVRAAGTWETTSPEDEDSAVHMKDLNKLGVLYSVGRASRGGAMRGEFYYPTDSYFKPYYGVAINYYRETAAEAAERLGIDVNDVSEDDFGHNGIVAIYSKTEHAGGEGISLNLWENNTLTELTSVSHVIPADTWHWLQIEFIEGEIRVKYKPSSGEETWEEIITFTYNQPTLPWKRETLGRGAVIVVNIVPQVTCYPLGAEDTTLGVESHSTFPSSGTVNVDGEDMTYSAKSTNTPPANWAAGTSKPPGWTVSPKIFWLTNNTYMSQDGGGFPGEPKIGLHVWATSYNEDQTDFTGHNSAADGAYNGLAVITLPSHSWAGIMRYFSSGNRTFRVVNFDNSSITMWIPNDFQYPSGWEQFIGDGSKGFWGAGGSSLPLYLNFDLRSILGFTNNPLEDPGYGTHRGAVVLKPALHISARGANDTEAVSHGIGVAKLNPGKYVQVLRVASFSQEEDLSIEDALKQIVNLAGGEVECKAFVDEEHEFTATEIVPVELDHKNFIATFDLPALADGQGVGIVFRGKAPCTIYRTRPFSTNSGAYYLEVRREGDDHLLSLMKQVGSSNLTVVLEEIPIRPNNTWGAGSPNIPIGTIKFSIQDNFISAWLNGRWLHTFYNEEYPDGNFVGFVSRISETFHIHISELDDLLADVVAGTRGNGMSVLSEILADRHVLFRDNADGSMYFYKTRTDIGTIPDLIHSISDTETSDVITRVRAEGLLISEIADLKLLKEHGNIFTTMNARHANTVSDAGNEANFLIDESWRNAQQKSYGMVPYPALQPGDFGDFTEPGGTFQGAVRGQTIAIGFSGNNFVCDAQAQIVRTNGNPVTVRLDDADLSYEGTVFQGTVTVGAHFETHTELSGFVNSPREKTTLVFTGSSVKVGYINFGDTDQMGIVLDGELITIDTAAGATGAYEWSSGELDFGQHTIEIRCESEFNYVALDYIEYVGIP